MESLLKEKPYKFVPLTSKVSTNTMIPHDGSRSKGTYSGKLYISIETLTPIHINDGQYSFEKGTLLNKFIRRNDEIIIPGSAFKGMIRSIFEAISESCSPTVPSEVKGLEAALPNKKLIKCSEEEVCPTCSVFGTIKGNGNKGKLTFGEFVLENQKDAIEYISVPQLKTPFPIDKNTKYPNERLYYADFYDDESKYDVLTIEEYKRLANERGSNRSIKFRGRKFYLHNFTYQERGKKSNDPKYEMVRKGNIFKGYITFDMLTKKELAILALSLGINKGYKYKIGYGKPAYFGSISIVVDDVKDRNERYKKGDSLTISQLKELVKEYEKNASLDVKVALNKLEEILSGKIQGTPWKKVNKTSIY